MRPTASVNPRPTLLITIVLALVLAAGGLAGLSSSAGSPPAQQDTVTVCPTGCDQSTIQGGVDQAGPGDTVQVGAGSYAETVTIASGKDGLRLLAEDGATLLLSPQDRLNVDAVDVIVHGFTIDQAEDEPAVVVTAGGLVLRDNTILGGLTVASPNVHVDARANHWGTDSYAEVIGRFAAFADQVTAAPFLLTDGTQDPPAPTVSPSGHCDAEGFTPRFIDEAIWCAHADGVVVLHPSSMIPPTPHQVPVVLDTPANQIYRNRDIQGTFAGGTVPDWAPGWGSEPLTGLTLCSGGPKESDRDPPEPSPGADCENDPAGVVVDAGVGLLGYVTGDGDNRPMTHTLDIRANDVNVSGLTITHTTNQADRHGVIVRSDGVTLQLNDIVGNFLPHEHDGSPTLHQMGLVLTGFDALVEDNEIRNWRNIGLHVAGSSGEENRVLDNLVQRSRWHGILIEGPKGGAPTLEVRGNEIHDHGHSAIRFGSGDTAGYQVRENLLGLTNLNAVTIQPGVQDAAIDVRLNDWSLYRHETLPGRVDDESGTNTVLQVPFLDSTGSPDPALPTNTDGSHSTVPATCNAHPDADWDPSAGECVYLSIQAAVDFAHPGGVVLVPGSSQLPPTPYLENVVVDTNSIGESLDGLTLCSTPGGTSCGGDPPTTRIDGSLTGAPAVTVQSASDVSVTGFTLEGSSPVARIVSTSGTLFEGNTVESLVSGSSAQNGLMITGAEGTEIRENLLRGNAFPGSIALNLDASSGATIESNDILLAGTGIRLAGSEDAMIGSNRVFQPPVSQFGGSSLGISLSGGSGHTTSENLLFGAGTGLRISGSIGTSSQQDHFLVEGTGVGLGAGSGATQPTGTKINDAHLVAAGTPLHLDGSTAGLDVDATCNDWGVYTATGVQTRIEDEGSGNLVEYVPFRAPDSSSVAFDCLQLPSVGLTAQPDEVLPGEAVAFEVETSSDRPEVQREWDFGDGNTLTQTAPFPEETTHSYSDTGTYFASVVVTDSEGGQGIGVVQVDVLNPAPRIHGVDHHSVGIGTPISLNYTVIDPNGGDVELEAFALPTGSALVEDQAEDRWRFEWTPAEDQAGSWLVSLLATDDEGATGLLLLKLDIAGDPPERLIGFLNVGPRPETASPGQTVEFTARVENLGDSPVQISFTNSTPAQWEAETPGLLDLSVGETREVQFNVTVGPSQGSGRVTVHANVLGSPEASKQLTYLLDTPLLLDVELEDTTTGSPITGNVTVSYADGSPATGVSVSGTRLNGPDVFGVVRSMFSGETNETGVLTFSFGTFDLAAQLPGTHIIEVSVTTDTHLYRGHTSYQVRLL